MSSYWTEFTIGGKLTATQKEGLDKAIDQCGFETIEEGDGRPVVCIGEMTPSDVDFLGNFCVENGLTYTVKQEGECFDAPSMNWWKPGMADTDNWCPCSNDGTYINVNDLGFVLGKPGALSKIEKWVSDSTPPVVPPLEIVEDPVAV